MVMLEAAEANMECAVRHHQWIVVTMRKRLLCLLICAVLHQVIMVVHLLHLPRNSHLVPLPQQQYHLRRQIQNAI